MRSHRTRAGGLEGVFSSDTRRCELGCHMHGNRQKSRALTEDGAQECVVIARDMEASKKSLAGPHLKLSRYRKVSEFRKEICVFGSPPYGCIGDKEGTKLGSPTARHSARASMRYFSSQNAKNVSETFEFGTRSCLTQRGSSSNSNVYSYVFA